MHERGSVHERPACGRCPIDMKKHRVLKIPIMNDESELIRTHVVIQGGGYGIMGGELPILRKESEALLRILFKLKHGPQR